MDAFAVFARFVLAELFATPATLATDELVSMEPTQWHTGVNVSYCRAAYISSRNTAAAAALILPPPLTLAIGPPNFVVPL